MFRLVMPILNEWRLSLLAKWAREKTLQAEASGEYHISCAKTVTWLAKRGIVCPTPQTKLLKVYLKFLHKRGLIKLDHGWIKHSTAERAI